MTVGRKHPRPSGRHRAFAGRCRNGGLGHSVLPDAAPLTLGNQARWATRGAAEALQASVAAGWRQRDARLTRRRGARKRPKRLRALHAPGQLVRGCTSACLHESAGGRSKRIRFDRASRGALRTARSPGQLGRRTWRKRQGITGLARGSWLRGGRGGDLVDVPVCCCLVADIDKRLGSKKPLSQT